MEEQTINLENFEVVMDVNGNAVQQVPGFVLLRNKTNNNVVQAHISQVADFYGLVSDSLPAEEAAEVCSPGPSTSTKTVTTWNEEQTRFLLNQYILHIDKVGPLKKFKNKKEMWENISQEIFENLGVRFSALQVENRFKNVSKKNKNIVKNNRTSGSTILTSPYDNEMRQIAAIDDSIEPEVIMTPTFIRRKRPAISEPAMSASEDIASDSETATPTPAKKKANKHTDVTIQIMEEYRAECERKEDRRAERARQHKEKMEKLDRLNNILEELVKKIPSQTE